MKPTVTKLNALRRLTMKVHAESPAPRKHKEWRIRLYDGDVVVGYVGWHDLLKIKISFEEAVGMREEADTIVGKLADLYKQATTERSHYYVAQCCLDAMMEIERLRDALDLKKLDDRRRDK